MRRRQSNLGCDLKMYTPFGWILVLLFTRTTYCRNIEDSPDSAVGDELILVHTLCRHGDRNIRYDYPNDPYKSSKYWPGGYGALTKVGMEQHFLLGQYFRERYSSLIRDGQYSADTAYIISTDTDRTLMSAEANLAGLFPPEATQMWNKNIYWQPIPVHTVPEGEDYVLHANAPCKRYDYEMANYLTENNRFNKSVEENRPLIDFIKMNAGFDQVNMHDLEHNIHDTLTVEQLKGFDIPDWGRNIMVPGGDFERFILDWYTVRTATTVMMKLKSGFLLKEILDRCTNKTQSTLSPDRSLWMYFAHDHTIMDTLHSMGLFKPHKPPYASCLFFELYKTSDTPYVKLYYRNSTEPNLPPLDIPGCGVECPLPTLYKVLADVLPTDDHETECKLRDDESFPAGGNPMNSYF